MMRKLFGVVAVAAASLAMTVPAGATNAKHVTWKDGGATLRVTSTSWQTSMHVRGLKPGTYDYVIGVFIGKNGIPQGGISRRICKFTSTSVKNTYTCTAHGTRIAPHWGAPQKPNLFTGEIDVDLGYTAYPVPGDLANFS